MQAHCSGKGGKGPVDTPGIGTVGGGKACMGPRGPLACPGACDRSSSATRWRNMRSSRRSCNATFPETTYSTNAPTKHEIIIHKPNTRRDGSLAHYLMRSAGVRCHRPALTPSPIPWHFPKCGGGLSHRQAIFLASDLIY